MVRSFNRDESSISLGGKLIVEEMFQGGIQVFLIPSEDKLIQSGLDPTKADDYRAKLLEVFSHGDYISIYPTNTLGGHPSFLKPKYKQIESISLIGFDLFDSIPENADDVIYLLEALPSGFIKDYDYGLGLLKEYRFIVEAVEDLSNCTHLSIKYDTTSGIDKQEPDFFKMSYEDFENARKMLNRISDRANLAVRSVKQATIYNLLAAHIGAKEKPIQIGENPINRLVAQTAQGDEYLKESEKEVAIEILSRNTKAIAETKPEKLAKLRNDIELVTLEVLIERYQTMLDQKLKEDRWQALFNENPFMLSLVFGYPIIKVKDQAFVGGRKLTGSGEKITDFLAKNSLTNNTALFEIKMPQTILLNKIPYREGIFTPSVDLSGSINQALDQKYQFERQIAQIKENRRIYDIESYAVHSCVIIGKAPGDIDQQKSFELFRHNSKDVQIVTFDELLEKLCQLRVFLAAGDEAAS